MDYVLVTLVKKDGILFGLVRQELPAEKYCCAYAYGGKASEYRYDKCPQKIVLKFFAH